MTGYFKQCLFLDEVIHIHEMVAQIDDAWVSTVLASHLIYAK
jgi:hypothetical protein